MRRQQVMDMAEYQDAEEGGGEGEDEEGITDAGLASFFSTWTTNPALTVLSISRNPNLSTAALKAILLHSGNKLEKLDINGWKEVGEDALRMIGGGTMMGRELTELDVGWCRNVDDFMVKTWLFGEEQTATGGGCPKLKEIKVWGCNKVTTKCPRKPGVSIYGVESQVVS